MESTGLVEDEFLKIDFSEFDLSMDSILFEPNNSVEPKNRKRTNSINKDLKKKYIWLDEKNIISTGKEWNNLLKKNNSYPACNLLKLERRKFLNRHSARECSKRKKKYLNNLLTYVKKLESENEFLKTELFRYQLRCYSN